MHWIYLKNFCFTYRFRILIWQYAMMEYNWFWEVNKIWCNYIEIVPNLQHQKVCCCLLLRDPCMRSKYLYVLSSLSGPIFKDILDITLQWWWSNMDLEAFPLILESWGGRNETFGLGMHWENTKVRHTIIQ